MGKHYIFKIEKMPKFQIRKIIALPLLKPEIVQIFWQELKKCPVILSDNAESECNEFVNYMEKEWLRKCDSGRLFNFNRMTRTRGINAAEAYHSSIRR